MPFDDAQNEQHQSDFERHQSTTFPKSVKPTFFPGKNQVRNVRT
jgi:hypothetical protein